MPNAVVLANGIPPGRATLEAALGRATLFICADGGANAARAYGLTPHAIVGDLDSASSETLAHFHDVRVIRDVDPERTDAEKAVDWALAQGKLDEITLFGATAGRFDHVVGNLSLLHRYKDQARVRLEDDTMEAWLSRDRVTLDRPPGTVVSFFAVGGPAEGVTTQNLRYALHGRRLELGVQDSVSNVVEASPASIHVVRGELLVIVIK